MEIGQIGYQLFERVVVVVGRIAHNVRQAGEQTVRLQVGEIVVRLLFDIKQIANVGATVVAMRLLMVLLLLMMVLLLMLLLLLLLLMGIGLLLIVLLLLLSILVEI